MRFQWSGNLYKFFGSHPPSRIFRKLTKVILSILKKLNLGKIIYLDDTLLLEKTFQEVLMARGTVISLL